MKRSVQEIVELVVFGAIALLIGTGVLWLVGWIFTGLGWLSLAITGLLWRVLLVLVPIIIIAGLIYWLVTYLMKQRSERAAVTTAAPAPADQVPADTMPGTAGSSTAAAEAVAEPVAGPDTPLGESPAEASVTAPAEPEIESPAAGKPDPEALAPETVAAEIPETEAGLPEELPGEPDASAMSGPVSGGTGPDTAAAEETGPAPAAEDHDVTGSVPDADSDPDSDQPLRNG